MVEEVKQRIIGHAQQVVAAREGFERANDEGRPGTAVSVTRLESPIDLFWNLPKALQLAAFAPFPNALLSSTPGVSNLRRFVLLELLPYLAVLVGAVVGAAAALAGRRGSDARRQTVFILLVVLIAYALLGTVVVNGGTLYRFRQPYVLLQIVLAAEGWRWLMHRFRSAPSSETVVHAS